MDPNNQNQNAAPDDQSDQPTPPAPQPGQNFTASPPPQQTPPQQQPQPQPETPPPSSGQQSDEVPDYIKGSDGPPAPGQSMHPRGGYQPKPGETVQRSAAGGAVVKNLDDETNVSSVYGPPGVPPPSQPKTTRRAEKVQPQSPQPMQQPVYSDQPPQTYGGRFGRFSGNRTLKVLLLIVVLLAIAAGVYYFYGTDEITSPDTSDVELQNDVSVIAAGIENYALRNGDYPTLEPQVVEELSANHLPTGLTNPLTGEPYVLVSEAPATGEVQYVLGGQCADASIEQTSDERVFAVLTVLTSGDTYCLDKQPPNGS